MKSDHHTWSLRRQDQPVTLDELVAFFEAHGFSQYKIWGRTGTGTKSIHDLLREINEDGVILVLLPDGRIARLAERVFIRAWYKQDGDIFVIRETCRIFRDGTPDWRNPPFEAADAGFTETKNPHQSVYDVVLQGLHQELGIKFGKNSVRRRIQHVRLVPMGPGHRSVAYFGIVTIDYGYVVAFELRKRDRRIVYVEYGPDGVVTVLQPIKEPKDMVPPTVYRKRLKLPLVF